MDICSVCNENNYILYKFPCRHIICENCLISENKNFYKCRRCGGKYKKEHIMEVEDDVSDYSDEYDY